MEGYGFFVLADFFIAVNVHNFYLGKQRRTGGFDGFDDFGNGNLSVEDGGNVFDDWREFGNGTVGVAGSWYLVAGG